MRRYPRIDPRRQLPFNKDGADLGYAQIARLAFALAHDVEQHRPFALHQLAIDGAPVSLGALEIRVHVGGDLAAGQAALRAAAHRVRPVFAERAEMLDLLLMDMSGRIKN